MTEPTTVLVADDDRTIRRNLVLLLRSEGYLVLEAADGKEALAQIAEHAPDAVLLDLKMPGRDGLDVLAGARAGTRRLAGDRRDRLRRLGLGDRGDPSGSL